MQEIREFNADFKYVKIKGKEYKVGACPLGKLPELIDMLAKFEKISDDEIIKDEKNIGLMVDIMAMGLLDYNEGLTKEFIRNNFGLGAFPIILNYLFELNDFLSGMGELKRAANVVDLGQKKKRG